MRVLLSFLAFSACVPRQEPSPNGVLAGDTLRGRIEVVGSEPGTEVALLLDGGARAVTLTGGLRPALDRAAGLEVVVWGEPEGTSRFRIQRFAVRAASGVPAVDGTLVQEGGRYLLVTAEGERLPLPHLPSALAGRAGARVWLAGPLDRQPDSFGTIAEAGQP